MAKKVKTKKKQPRKRFRDSGVPAPPGEKRFLGSYTLNNRADEQRIREYVEWQARDERVEHAEQVKTERLLGRIYDCWDVHTNKGRWWVITSPTNLYSQQHFPSLD